MENYEHAAGSLQGIRVLAEDPIHMQTMTQTQVFSGDQTVEMACRFLTKPLVDDVVRRPVKERSLNTTATATPANTDPRCIHVVRQDGTSRKRPVEVDHSDNGGFDGRTSKKINFQWATQKQLNGTEDNTQKNIREPLEHDSVRATMDQVSSHLQKYKPDSQFDLLSTTPTTSLSYSNDSWMNYSTSQDSEGSSGFNMRSLGARNLNQISRLSGSTSPVGLGVYANGSSTTGLGGAAIKGPTSSTSNGNGNSNANGYGYRYGSGNSNSYGNLNDNGYGYGYADGNGGHGGVLTDGIMSNASFSSNLAQPIQQPIPTFNLFPSNTVCAMDNPNHTRQQELVPQLYRLSYDCRNGGISMSPWPQDDGADLRRRYQGENEVTENTVTMDVTHGIKNAATVDMPQGMQTAAIGEMTKEMLGDGQTSAVQPQGLGGEFSNWESTTFGTAGTSAGGVVTDETLDWLTPAEFENLMNTTWSEL
ncbi:cell wall protein IFF6-like [Hordeum vulgare subsp. vulgare]|uniref:cell wall protein IFF6-like n=1 Tax=Hordeum vulgare subsp. vulgare TaxID=112509 RepID=UPI001B84C867|nr:cell wall protein IFF6-like [Hordeum vulgare subsp. vulgare]